MMVILGLGTNIGDRLAHLRLALAYIKKIPHLTVKQISPIYSSHALLPDHAPTEWNKPYLNLALRCDTTLTPEEIWHHTKKIEKNMAETQKQHWGPRVMDIDLLAYDDCIIYNEKLHIPHEHLCERPFALWPFADVAPHWKYPLPGKYHGKTAAELAKKWNSRFDGSAPLSTKQIQQRIDTPQCVGIINITPDSFSDGGEYLAQHNALEHIQKLITDGADIIDIGAEATGPSAITIDPLIEWQRLESILKNVIEKSRSMIIPPKISIDTRNPTTAEKALALGIDWINDVSGLKNPAMREVIKNAACKIVFMHHLDVPVNKNNHLPYDCDAVTEVYSWAKKQIESLEKEGIKRERLIFDPGIGYGKTPEQSLELIKHISEFHALGVELLMGHSRKSFLNQFISLPPAERDLESLIISLHCANANVNYLRVHNVNWTMRALKIEKIFSAS